MTSRYAGLLGIFVVFCAANAHAQCVPGPGQAAFFVDDQYHGSCVVRGIGNYPTATSTGLPNDSITSIRVGPGVQVYVCRDEYFGGACELITQNVPNLGSHAIGNDQITSFKVQPIGAQTTCTPGANQVAFFVDANFAGACVIRSIGSYPTATSVGLPNDSISSIRVGPGAQVYVCRDDYYQGTCELITATVSFLGGHAIGNDTITSAKVQPAGSPTNCAPADNQVAFFRDANFTGPCQIRGFGIYPSSEAIGLPNDSITSFRVGSAAQVIVCKDNSFGGDCQLFTSSIANMGSQRIGNDQISSAKVQALGTQECQPGALQVGFFVHSNFVAPCSVRGLGTYPTAQTMGVPNDSVSSLLIGQGAQAVVCVDNNFGNDCERFTSNASYLGNNRIGDNRISSAKVLRAGELECNPGDTEVAFFEHADLIAPCTTRGIGEYPTAESIGLPNDSISSIKVGPGAQAILCVDVNYGGDCQKLTGTVSNMASTRIGNDQTTSARVQHLGDPDCPPAPNQASFYKHSDFIAPCVVKGMGDYANAMAIGLDDNSISSIRVGASVQVCACEAPNFMNVCETFTTDDPNLGNNFPSLGGGNDIISSVKVQNRGAECKAVVQPPQGYSQVEVFNCHPEQHTVHIWMRDLTIGGSYLDQGTQASNWSSGSCPIGAPKVIALKKDHQFDFVIVDPAHCNGQNDPTNLDCIKSTFGPLLGVENAPSYSYQVN